MAEWLSRRCPWSRNPRWLSVIAGLTALVGGPSPSRSPPGQVGGCTNKNPEPIPSMTVFFYFCPVILTLSLFSCALFILRERWSSVRGEKSFFPTLWCHFKAPESSFCWTLPLVGLSLIKYVGSQLSPLLRSCYIALALSSLRSSYSPEARRRPLSYLCPVRPFLPPVSPRLFSSFVFYIDLLHPPSLRVPPYASYEGLPRFSPSTSSVRLMTEQGPCFRYLVSPPVIILYPLRLFPPRVPRI